MIPFAANATATAAAKIANAFEWPGQPTKLAPSPAHRRVPRNFTMGRYVFRKKLPLPLGDPVLRLTHMVPMAHPSNHPKQHLVRFSGFCMDRKCYAVQCIVNGKENRQNCPFPWDFVKPPEEDQTTAIGNVHKNG